MITDRAGKYSGKHPAGTIADPAIVTAIVEAADHGQLSCSLAHDLASKLGVAPADFGKTLDLLDYRITACQLGLFGHSPETKIVSQAETVSDVLRERLVGAVPHDKITCEACWEVAQELGMERLSVACACETLGLKIGPCQLGAF